MKEYEIKQRKYDNKYCLYHKGVNAVIATFTSGTMAEQNDVIAGLNLRNSQYKVAQNSTAPTKSSPKLPTLEEVCEVYKSRMGIKVGITEKTLFSMALDIIAGKIGR